jgi:immunity protein, SdpI family
MMAQSERAMESNPRLSPVTILPLVTIVASAWLAAVLEFYRELPELLPTHWSGSWKADGFTAKPWGPFVLPLTMTVVWLARRVLRHLSFPRSRVERFPGAFDFRIMLTIGLVFVIWNLVIAQCSGCERWPFRYPSRSWLRGSL